MASSVDLFPVHVPLRRALVAGAAGLTLLAGLALVGRADSTRPTSASREHAFGAHRSVRLATAPSPTTYANPLGVAAMRSRAGLQLNS